MEQLELDKTMEKQELDKNMEQQEPDKTMEKQEPDKTMKKQELETILNKIEDCVEQFDIAKDRTIAQLLEIQDKMDQLTSDVRVSHVAGSTATVLGGTMAAIGFIGSFFTFGLSSPLIIAGGSIAAAGGVTNAGANLVDYFKNKTLFAQAQAEMTKLTEAYNSLSTSLTKLDEIAPDLIKELQDQEFRKVLTGGTSLVKNGVSIAKHVNFVQFVSHMQMRAADLGVAGGTTAKALFQNVSVVGSPIFQIGMGALGVIMVPVDIYTLVTNSIDLQNGKPSDVSKCVQEMIDQIKKL